MLVGVWAKILEEVQERQARYDKRMLKSYYRRRDLAEHDVRFIFRIGDRVLLRQRAPGKMQVRARGPFTFRGYTGRLGVNAQVEGPPGKV